MINEKYLFFRDATDEDDIGLTGGVGRSIVVPASSITAMVPIDATTLRIAFNSLKNQLSSPSSGGQVVSDFVDLTIEDTNPNCHIEVSTAILQAINGNDDFIVVADDVVTFTDNTTRGSGEYIHHRITACNITIADTLDFDAANAVTGATEATLWNSYGEGAVSTSSAPTYSQVRVGDEIISTIEIDLTGLLVKGTAKGDAIGLDGSSAVKNAWISRYYEATMGKLYKVEFICMEVPTHTSGTITTDIDFAFSADNEIEYDGEVNTTPQIDTGGFAALGWKEQTIATSPTNEHYLYIVEGNTAATDGVYAGGKIVIKFHGRATY